MKKNLLKIALLVLCIVPCVYGFYRYDLQMYLTDRNKVEGLISSFGPMSVLALILLQAVQVVIAPIPGDVTGFIGGYLFGSVLGHALFHHRPHHWVMAGLLSWQAIRAAAG